MVWDPFDGTYPMAMTDTGIVISAVVMVLILVDLQQDITGTPLIFR